MDSLPSCARPRVEQSGSSTSSTCVIDYGNPVLSDRTRKASGRALRVCFVSHGSGRGGAEEALLETLECLKENGFDCLVLMPGDVGLSEELKKLNVSFWKVPYWPWMGNRSFGRRAQSVARNILLSVPVALKLKKWNPDIIYSNTMTVCFGAMLAALLGRPHVWHVHEIGFEDHGLRFDLGDSFSYKLLGSASACVAVSQITAERLSRHVDRAKIKVLLQSVHRHRRFQAEPPESAARESLPERKNAMHCIIIGRLSEGKRQEDAVQAIAELRGMGADADLVMVGAKNPEYAKKLRSHIRALNLQQYISIREWMGPGPLGLCVQRADVILMCSRFEAFGRVTVEGMLAGKPVVAANTGANPELIQDGVTGLLYKAGDPRDLAAKIQYLHDNPELAKRIGQNARLWAEGIFNKDRFSSEIVPFLRSIADSPVTQTHSPQSATSSAT